MTEISRTVFFAPIPSNVCIDPTAISFLIVPPDGRVDVVDVDIVKTGDDFEATQRQANSKRGPKTDKVGECAEQIVELLKDGDAQASEMMESLKAEGFGTSTIREAKKQLGVKSIGKGTNTLWHLPTDSTDSVVENAD